MAEPAQRHRRTRTTVSVLRSLVQPRNNEQRPGSATGPAFSTSFADHHNGRPDVNSYRPPATARAAVFPNNGHPLLPPDHPHSRRPDCRSTPGSRVPSTGSSKSAPDRQRPPATASFGLDRQRPPQTSCGVDQIERTLARTVLRDTAAAHPDGRNPKQVKSAISLASVFGAGGGSGQPSKVALDGRDKENKPSSPGLHNSNRPGLFGRPQSRALRPQGSATSIKSPALPPSERSSREYYGADIPRLTRVDKHSRTRPEPPTKTDGRQTPSSAGTSRFSRFAPFGLSRDKNSNSKSSSGKTGTRTGLFGRSSKQDAPTTKSALSRGQSKVAEVVAAFNERARAAAEAAGGASQSPTRPDPEKLEAEFEAVLESRNIAPQQRVHMRTLKPEVKAQFIKSHRESPAASSAPSPPTSTAGSTAKSRSSKIFSSRSSVEVSRDAGSTESTKDKDRGRPSERDRMADRGRTLSLGRRAKDKDKDRDETKKRRPRSRAFTFGRSDPSGKKKGGNEDGIRALLPKSPSATSVCSMSDGRGGTVGPGVFVDYLIQTQSPQDFEVGRLHKLRLLIRNETVSWVDEFIGMGGMDEIVSLLGRIMAVEWREEHEDQLLHESLLCLKGLCTTARALDALPAAAPTLFPSLIGMVFDREHKGPSEFTTRAIITNLLFMYLSAAPAETICSRAAEILGYLRDVDTTDKTRHLPWVEDVYRARPYMMWCKEVVSVSKEVFWIFLHSLNVVPLPTEEAQPVETNGYDEFYAHHFPRARPPVPAAPHVGGVEWDATNYIAAQLDLMNGLVAATKSQEGRNRLRTELRASGWEKMMGGTLRKCKEKFYSAVHDGLRTWVAAAVADDWEARAVRMGPDEKSAESPTKRTGPDTRFLPPVDAGRPMLELNLAGRP